MALGDTPTTKPTTNINVNRFDLLQAARWHQARVDFTGQFEIEELIPTFVGDGSE